MDFDPELMKIKICRKCKGVGFGQDLKGHRFRCAECTGTGRIVVRTLKNELTMQELNGTDGFDEETMKVKVCKVCDGLGVKRFGQEEHGCDECGATGRLIEQKIVTEYQMHHVEGLGASETADSL